MRPQQIWNIVHAALLGVTLLLCLCFGIALFNPFGVVATQPPPPTLAQISSPTPGLPEAAPATIGTLSLPATVTVAASATSTLTPSTTSTVTATSTLAVTDTATATPLAPTDTPESNGYPGDQTPPPATTPPGGYP
jgi:hypothetical protein